MYSLKKMNNSIISLKHISPCQCLTWNGFIYKSNHRFGLWEIFWQAASPWGSRIGSSALFYLPASQCLVSERTSRRGTLCCTLLFTVRNSCLADHHLLGLSAFLTKWNEPFQFFRHQRWTQKKFCVYVWASGLRTRGKSEKEQY